MVGGSSSTGGRTFGDAGMIGRTISHYRVEEKLGEGGMGVVYRATDLSLNRPVAIKFLSSSVADEERRRRFQQEAQTASSLNHPHILTVFEAGTHEGQQYLVTEFIDGWSLREWARREKPSPRQMVDLLVGVADGLATAHQAGIIHRDIKPENILVSKNGYAKLVDFGLAKVLEPASADGETRTVSALATRAGVIMGTVAYMSPEQAAGKPVDARSDIFAFGVVLHELLSGERPFTGPSDIETLHAILHSQPRTLNAPYELRPIVEKALEKDPAERYQSMREVVVDLKRAQRMKTGETFVETASHPAPRRRWWIAAAVGAGILLAAAVTVWRWWQSDFWWKNPLEGAQFTRLTDFEGIERDAAISPDGKFVVFLADRDGIYDAWVTQVGSGEFVNLTKGRFPELLQESVRCVGFSHDGAQVWLRQQAAGKTAGIWTVPTIGGVPRPFLGPVTGGVSWSPDGNRIAYFEGRDGDPIFVADRNGSNPTKILAEKLGDHRHFPTWSPNGRFIYFVKGIPHSRETDIWRIRSTGGEPERITHHNTDLKYPTLLDSRTLIYTTTADDGSGPWLYVTDVGQRIPRRVSFGLVRYTSVSATADGRRLVVTEANPTANLWTIPISDRIVAESAARRVSLPTTRAVAPAYGPGYFVYLSSKGGPDGLWKFQDGAATELWKASEGAVVAAAAVSTDGRRIAFSMQKQGRTALHVMSADGTQVQPLAPSLEARGTPAWSLDGKSVVVAAGEGEKSRLFQVPVDGGPPVPLLEEISSVPVCSPDGRIIAYCGPSAAGTIPIKAITPQKTPVPFPDLRVRAAGGNRFRFLPDGKTLAFLRGDDRRQNFWLLNLATGRERQLSDLQPGYSMRSFDVSPDGKQILFDRVRESSDIVLIDLAR